MNNTQIRLSFSEYYTPGIIIINNLYEGKIEINHMIFYGNHFSSNDYVNFYGTSLFIRNNLNMFMSDCLFYGNINNYPNEEFGGPAVIYDSKKGNLQIKKSYFIKNQSWRGSLSINFYGYNLSISSCFFYELIRLDQFYSSAFLVVGELNFLFLFNCIFDNIMADEGMFILNDITVTHVFIDRIFMLFIAGYSTNACGISIGSETKNKVIEWKNSVIFSNLEFDSNALVIFVFVKKIIKNLSISFLDNLICNNTLSPFRYYGIIFVFWAYSKDISLKVEKCNITNNDNIISVASIYGLIYLINFSFVSCFLSKNNFETLFEGDRYFLNITQILVLYNDFDLSLSSSRSYITIEKIHYENVIRPSFKFINTEFHIKNIFIVNSYSDDILCYFKNILYASLSNMYLKNFSSSNIFDIKYSTNISFENITMLFSNFDSIINLRQYSTLEIRNIFLENIDVWNMILISKKSYLNISRIVYKIYELYNSNNMFLIAQDSTLKIDKFIFSNIFCSFTQIQIRSINSNLSIKNFYANSFISLYPFIRLTKGFLFLSNSILNNFTSWINAEKSTIKFHKTLFSNNEKFYLQLNYEIHVYQFIFKFCLNINFKCTNFSNIQTNLTSPILIQNSYSDYIFKINNCSFNHLVSHTNSGGALFVSNVKIQILNSSFSHNIAFNYGGAIYFECFLDLIGFCDYSIINNVFENNSAGLCGGAYKWKYYQPNEIKNIFKNNKALFSGQDYSSFFIRLGFQFIAKEKNDEIIIFDSFGSNSSDQLIISNEKIFNQKLMKKYKMYSNLHYIIRS